MAVRLAAGSQVLPLGCSQLVSSFHMLKSRVAFPRATRSPVEKRWIGLSCFIRKGLHNSLTGFIIKDKQVSDVTFPYRNMIRT